MLLAKTRRSERPERFFPKNSKRHCQLQQSRLDTYQKLREEVVLYAEARGYVAPKMGQVAKAREDGEDPWELEDSDNRKHDPLLRERGRTSLAKGKEQENWCKSHQDSRTRKRFKVSVDRRIAGQGHSSNRTKDNQILLERETM